MMSSCQTMLAWRYLRARRQEGFISLTSWFAVIGITLGVATLILVTSLMNGIRDEMTSRFIGIDGHVVIYGGGRAFTNYQSAVDAIKPIAGIDAIAPKVTGQVMVTSHGRAIGAQATAMPWDALSGRKLFTDHVESGSLEGLRDGTGIVLGSSLARNLGVIVGDSVTLISPQGRATIAGFIPRMKAYPVIGTIKLGMHEFDSSLILMPFTEAQNYFLMMTPEGEAVSNLEVMVKNVGDAPGIATQIREKLGGQMRVYDWQQTNASVFAALAVQRNVMVVILALIVLVAAFNIISSLVMLVKEKQSDIAVLRTMGMSRAHVMRIFITAGTLLGSAGTVAGVGLGLVLAAYLEPLHHLLERALGQEILVENIYFLSTLPTKTNPLEVVVIVLASLALSFLSTLYPARRAARLDPVEALRHE